MKRGGEVESCNQSAQHKLIGGPTAKLRAQVRSDSHSPYDKMPGTERVQPCLNPAAELLVGSAGVTQVLAVRRAAQQPALACTSSAQSQITTPLWDNVSRIARFGTLMVALV